MCKCKKEIAFFLPFSWAAAGCSAWPFQGQLLSKESINWSLSVSVWGEIRSTYHCQGEDGNTGSNSPPTAKSMLQANSAKNLYSLYGALQQEISRSPWKAEWELLTFTDKIHRVQWDENAQWLGPCHTWVEPVFLPNSSLSRLRYTRSGNWESWKAFLSLGS